MLKRQLNEEHRFSSDMYRMLRGTFAHQDACKSSRFLFGMHCCTTTHWTLTRRCKLIVHEQPPPPPPHYHIYTHLKCHRYQKAAVGETGSESPSTSLRLQGQGQMCIWKALDGFADMQWKTCPALLEGAYRGACVSVCAHTLVHVARCVLERSHLLIRNYEREASDVAVWLIFEQTMMVVHSALPKTWLGHVKVEPTVRANGKVSGVLFTYDG